MVNLMLDPRQKPACRMTFKGIRSSKFRHVYGAPVKRNKCYDNVKITRNALDSNFCAVNPKFLAVVVEVGGGGSFLVIPLERSGRVEHTASKVSGHSRPVSDVKWNPFNDNIVASGSEDCTIKLWYIPDGGLQPTNKDMTEYLLDLQGHRRRVTMVEWHPTAENILVSAGYDHQIFVWNISKGVPVKLINCHNDVIYSMSFNRNGSLLATTCKDKKLRIIDPRAAEVLRIGESHQGTKASKVVYLGDTGKIFTTGSSRYSDREFSVWSQTDLRQPLETQTIDSSNGVLFPYYDHDTRMVYLAGKGDGNVRYYEVATDDTKPHVFYLSQFISGAPQRGFGILPKRGCDTSQCEIFRFYKLHATKDLVEPISMIVPRKSEVFQDDIYPETSAPSPALTAEEWLAGNNSNPTTMSLKTRTKVQTFKPMVYKPSENGNGQGKLEVSNRSNDRKFMFLSEETKPDYRPVGDNCNSRQAESSFQRTTTNYVDNSKHHISNGTHKSNWIEYRGGSDSPASMDHNQPGGTGSLNGRERSAYNNVNNKVTKFQHIQRKWGGLLSPPPPSPTTMVASPSSPFCGDRLVSETEESDMDNPMGGGGGPPTPKSPHKFAITSGSQTVKSLTNRYEDFMGETKGGISAEATADLLRQAVTDQKREIDSLRSQVATKDAKIRQLEQTLLKFTGGVSGISLLDNNMTSSTA